MSAPIDQSLWRAFQMPSFASSGMPNVIDVAIVGGGVTGLTAALLLKRAGKRVAVFERETIGSGDTGNTSAHLTVNTDLRISEMASRFGDDATRLVLEGCARAIDIIETNVHELNIDCGFTRVPGFLCSPFLTEGDDTKALREDVETATKLGVDCQFMEAGPITGKPAMSFADQALFHPLQYVAGLAKAVHGDGSFVFEQSEVSEVVAEPLSVVVNGQTIACQDVIVATHVPITGSASVVSAALLQTKLYPYSSYVLGARVDEQNGGRTLSPGLYNDTTDPYRYLRLHRDKDGLYAIFGGQDHKTGTVSETEECFAALEKELLTLIPSARIERRWSGQVIETTDELPFIGKTAEHQYSATGYSGTGLTFGTLAAVVMHDAVMGRDNPLAELMDPDRKAKSPGSIGTFLSENTSFPYYFVRDRLRRSDSNDVKDIEAGEGKVLTIDGKRVACSRTDDGALQKVSAVCTHLGCLVRWNGAEHTWDCPCHGSRFTPDGQVLSGPAETPLEPVE